MNLFCGRLGKISILAFLLILSVKCYSQRLTLDSVLTLARKEYPALRQKDLIRQLTALNLQNLSKGYLPQFSVNGQASYQSEVTRVDISIPGVTIPSPDKDQYKLTADLNQLIYDGGVTREQKKIAQLSEAENDQQVEVDWQQVKNGLDDLYLNILFLNEQLKQTDLVKSDLQTGISKVEAQVNNGVAFRSNLEILQAELIKTRQREIELRSTRKGLTETLGLFINRPLDEEVELVPPSVPDTLATTIKRPELLLFRNKTNLLGEQNKLIRARNLPKTSFFLQGGYGRPGLNLLKNEFDFFYIGGIRLNWPLNGLYTFRNDKKVVLINQQMVDVQKETFLLNTNTALKKQRSEIDKLQQFVSSDNEIIALRKSITTASRAQLENGVATASDYLREVNAEDQARQTKISHQLQLLMAQIHFQNITGE